jgi:hypothetical protein
MNLDSNTAPVPWTMPSKVAAKKSDHRVLDVPLDRCDDLAGVAFIPVSVQRFGDDPELDHEVA